MDLPVSSKAPIEDPIAACRRIADQEFVRSLRRYDFRRVAGFTALLWGQLSIAWAAALAGPWWAVILAAPVLIACQQAMVLWVHEASHFTLHSSKRLNDFWADVFFATPIGMNVETYRTNHMSHHTYLATENDLDRWTFEFDLHGWRGVCALLKLLSGWYGLKVAWKKYGAAIFMGRPELQERARFDRLAMAATWNLGLLGLCVLFGRWWLYPALWAYPLLSVTVLLNVLRTSAEHQPPGYDGCPERLASPLIARTTIPSPWEKWLLYQTNFNYHLEHHAFPYVPWFNLPRLYQHVAQRGYYENRPGLLQKTALAALFR